MLPQTAPGLGYFVSAAEMMPCRMTGGDFYEYVPLDDDTLGFTLGDVAGKGAPAGLFGAWIQEIFLAQSVRLIEPAATIVGAHVKVKKFGRVSSRRCAVSGLFGVLDQQEDDGLWTLCETALRADLQARVGASFASTRAASVHSPRRGVAPVFRVAYGWEDVGEGPGTSGPS